MALHVTSGPALERAGDLAAILTKLEDRDVLFVDEIHRLSHAVEEILYPAMEDFQLDIVVGKGPAASSIRLTLPPFTLVGATTRTGMITGPLRDRFGLVARLDYYDAAELQAIVVRAAGILDVPIDTDGAWEIARRSRGTPRIANRLLRRVRDFAEVRGDGSVDAATAREGLAVFGVDGIGLDKVDRAILGALCQQFTAARSACRRSPSPSASSPRPWRTCTSRSSSNRACSRGPPGGGWRCPPRTPTWGSPDRRRRPPGCSTDHLWARTVSRADLGAGGYEDRDSPRPVRGGRAFRARTPCCGPMPPHARCPRSPPIGADAPIGVRERARPGCCTRLPLRHRRG